MAESLISASGHVTEIVNITGRRRALDLGVLVLADALGVHCKGLVHGRGELREVRGVHGPLLQALLQHLQAPGDMGCALVTDSHWVQCTLEISLQWNGESIADLWWGLCG